MRYHIIDDAYIPENASEQDTRLLDHTFSYDQVIVLDTHFLKFEFDGRDLRGVE